MPMTVARPREGATDSPLDPRFVIAQFRSDQRIKNENLGRVASGVQKRGQAQEPYRGGVHDRFDTNGLANQLHSGRYQRQCDIAMGPLQGERQVRKAGRPLRAIVPKAGHTVTKALPLPSSHQRQPVLDDARLQPSWRPARPPCVVALANLGVVREVRRSQLSPPLIEGHCSAAQEASTALVARATTAQYPCAFRSAPSDCFASILTPARQTPPQYRPPELLTSPAVPGRAKRPASFVGRALAMARRVRSVRTLKRDAAPAGLFQTPGTESFEQLSDVGRAPAGRSSTQRPSTGRLRGACAAGLTAGQ